MQAIILETRPSFPIDSIPHIEIPNGLYETVNRAYSLFFFYIENSVGGKFWYNNRKTTKGEVSC
ncbi:Uncharacterised protein [Streptococcus suis]|uniref:Uncharacterized protein n=1 Tax=Streptococcus suis TaxID=1307 RepID=A0A0Z8NCL7_STRSU|nr:Uncharacterised protein [Streptococcus suis]